MGGRGRLYWRCRRGMLELDLLLQGFLDGGYADLDAAGRRAFERLLETPDSDLQDLLLGGKPPDDTEVAHVIEAIRRTAAA